MPLKAVLSHCLQHIHFRTYKTELAVLLTIPGHEAAQKAKETLHSFLHICCLMSESKTALSSVPSGTPTM